MGKQIHALLLGERFAWMLKSEGMALLSEASSLSIHLLRPGFKNSLREKLYQLLRRGDILIDIDLRQPGHFWFDKVAQFYAAAGTYR